MIIRVKDNSLFLLVGQIVLGDEKFQLGLGSLSDQALISAAKDPDNNWQVRQAAVNALKDGNKIGILIRAMVDVDIT